MRFHSPRRSVLALVLLAGVLAVTVGCPSHEDFPQPLDVTYPPKPTSFVITNPQNFDYDFNWSISNPSIVKGYRIYLVGGGALGGDELIGETTSPTFLATFPLSVANLTFAVRAISTDNVEGLAAVAVAP